MHKFLTVTALVLAASVLPAKATTIALVGPSSTPAGSTFDLTVQISDVFVTHPGDGFAGFGFDVAIGNPAQVSYAGYTMGSLFSDFSGVFGPSPQVAGVPDAPFFVFNSGDFSEPLTLVTLHFNALTTGPTSIGITSDPLDPNQGLFYSTAGIDPLNASTDETVTAATATPEPGVGWLAAAGLVSLLGMRRRR